MKYETLHHSYATSRKLLATSILLALKDYRIKLANLKLRNCPKFPKIGKTVLIMT